MAQTIKIVLPDEFDEMLNKKIQLAVANQLAVAKAISTGEANKPKWYNLGEAAKYANVSRNTLKLWTQQGLPCMIVGGTKRIKRVDIERFMEEKTRTVRM